MATAVILPKEKQKTKRIKTSNFAFSKIFEKKRNVRIKGTLPFRVRFTTITVPGYNTNNIPGIGIQVIGYSNYIL
jgi:hypothetical protein